MPAAVAKIAIPAPLYRLFDYAIPETLQDQIQVGVRVQVPFGRQDKIGIVVELAETSTFKRLKAINAVLDEAPLIDEKMMELVLWGARHYLAPPGEAFRAVLPAAFWKPTKRRRTVKPPPAPAAFQPKDINFNEGQLQAIETIWGDIDSRRVTRANLRTVISDAAEGLRMRQDPSTGIYLLHGVTGSGKTEVYLELARRLLDSSPHTSILILVPEIGLTPQLLGRSAAELPVPVVGYHSGMTPRQRQEVWEQCQRGDIRVVVGTRSALFLPLQELQMIVVDEEHDGSFKQEERYRYNARDLAIVRGRIEEATVILGSATPSLESLQRCRENKYQYLTLPERAGPGELPKLEFVDLGREASDCLLSRELAEGIDDTLQRGEQCMLFLNRRGFSPVQLCRDCGAFLQCPHCQISLTLHKGKQRLVCHYCLYEQKEAPTCSSCGSARVIWVGHGTERIEEDLQQRFPRARIARLDRDTTAKKGVLEATLEAMRQGQIDILVGTQILTKGHDYSQVTLVGVLLAEGTLNFPDFRASERTFQVITQVAGRAGRGDQAGRVIIQGYQPQHYVMRAALDHDYAGLSDRELATRRDLHYPPFARLIQLVFRALDSSKTIKACASAADHLNGAIGKYGQLLGPAPCAIEKLRGQYRWQLLIKTHQYPHVRDRLQACLDADFPNILPSGVHVAVDVDPLNML